MKPQKFFPFFLKKNSDSNEEIVWGELFSDVSAGENPHDLKLSKNLSNDLIVDYLIILKAYDLRTAVPIVSGSDHRFH